MTRARFSYENMVSITDNRYIYRMADTKIRWWAVFALPRMGHASISISTKCLTRRHKGWAGVAARWCVRFFCAAVRKMSRLLRGRTKNLGSALHSMSAASVWAYGYYDSELFLETGAASQLKGQKMPRRMRANSVLDQISLISAEKLAWTCITILHFQLGAHAMRHLFMRKS